MPMLHCIACKTPLNPPRASGSHWVATCAQCGTDHWLEATSTQAFMPRRFCLVKPPSRTHALGALLCREALQH